MLTSSERKKLRLLQQKKGRAAERAFLVEGAKGVGDLLQEGWPVVAVYATPNWAPAGDCPVEIHRISAGEMAGISVLETPSPVLAVASMREEKAGDLRRGRWLALDGLQDPGNMGTILRLADWFGLAGVICSPDTVEVTNPKVVQASMGSVFRVPWRVRDLPALFQELPAEIWTGGAFLDGENLFAKGLPAEGILVVGNEGRGIRSATEARLRNRLTIPRFGRAESLNAAMAAALFCAEWRRGG